MISEKKRVILYVVARLNDLPKRKGGITCHCDLFRSIGGMKPSTAERRLREIRIDYFNAINEWVEDRFTEHPRDYGYKTHRDHTWEFSVKFFRYLKDLSRWIQNGKD